MQRKGVSMNLAESEMGLARGYISKLDKANPNLKTLQKIADYFGVTADYLMNGEESKEQPELTARDERDIAKDMESLVSKLRDKESGPASFNGQDIPEEDIDLLAGQMELMLRRLKVINKEKYNPNKNKKG